MSEELSVWEHHNFLPESSVLIWLKPLKDFYSPSLLWWQETRLLMLLYGADFIYSHAINACVIHVVLGILYYCYWEYVSSLFLQKHLEPGGEEWSNSLHSELTASSLYFIQPIVGQVINLKTMPVYLWQGAIGHGVGYGNSSGWGAPCPPSSEHRIANRKMDIEKWTVEGRNPLSFDQHAFGTVALTLMLMDKEKYLPKTHQNRIALLKGIWVLL